MATAPEDAIGHQEIVWKEDEQDCRAHWRSENGLKPPKHVIVADDTLTADSAYRYACEGVAILWKGDFQNARQLLQAIARRVDRPAKKNKKDVGNTSALDVFNQYRLKQSQRARILGSVLIPCNADHSISLRRAPDISQACLEVYGPVQHPYAVSLRELMGLIGAHEWRKNGVFIPVLSKNGEVRIHPHYGVFSPLRGEYVDLVLHAPLPKAVHSNSLAFDIGVGTGVLAIALVHRGINRVLGTDQDQRALACAMENIKNLGLENQIAIVAADLFPAGKAALVVCNPPWVPARPSTPLERAVYDPESRMLKGFLGGLADHLLLDGEGWLILSDLAEHLGLRTREGLLEMIRLAGLAVLGRLDVKPMHKKVFDGNDALHAARIKETTSLWRLVPLTAK